MSSRDEPTTKFKIRFVIPGDVKEYDEPNGHIAEVFSDFKFIDNNFADMPCSNVPNEPGLYEGMIHFFYVDEEEWYFELHDIEDITHPDWPKELIKDIDGHMIFDKNDTSYIFSEYDGRWHRLIYKSCPLCRQMASIDIPQQFIDFMKAMHEKFMKQVREKGRTAKPWEEFDGEFLMNRLEDEWNEWNDSFDRRELIDIANFCMYLYHKKGPRYCKTCGSPIIDEDNTDYYDIEKGWRFNDPPPEVAEREHKRWKDDCEEQGIKIVTCPTCRAEMTEPLRKPIDEEQYDSPPDITKSIEKRGIEPDMRHTIVLDLDGVIVDFQNCESKCDYTNYPNADLDRENCRYRPGSCEAIDELSKKGYTIIIMTGRVEAEREVTERWLRKHDIHYDKLIMDKPRGFIYVDDLGYRFDTWRNLGRFIEDLEQKEKE